MVKITDGYGREVSVIGIRGPSPTVQMVIDHDNSFVKAHLSLTEAECLITLLKETIKFCRT